MLWQTQTPGEEGHSTAQARQLMLLAIRDPLQVVRLPPRDLDLTIRIMRRARLLGRLAWHLKQADLLQNLPRVARDALVGALALTEARARAARWELERIAYALQGSGVENVVALKGCAYLISGLPNAAGRLFADVDLLVAESELATVESHLTARGWRAMELTPYDENYYRVWAHELPPLKHVERDVEVDLHHNVVMRTSRARPDPQLLLARAREIPGSSFHVLAPIDMVLHAMTHLFYGGEMDDAVRDLVDIDDLLRHFAQHEPSFWSDFWPRAMQLDLQRPAFCALRYASRLLGTPVPESVLRESQAAAPAAPVLTLLDGCVPEALFPQHPDRHSRATAFARLLMYVRSHWVRMPPVMLARHLAHKFYARHFGSTLTVGELYK